ncbi:MAG: hypothetical protein FWE59_07175, partial [Oscillospiraceae bacterium]|nr:hypothetical protein [Oscillospiraceae bacterium]
MTVGGAACDARGRRRVKDAAPYNDDNGRGNRGRRCGDDGASRMPRPTTTTTARQGCRALRTMTTVGVIVGAGAGTTARQGCRAL